ncbi:MAG: glycine cleavage system aminomethyltransferase GcvT [Candidatus Hadarchaeum sp.]|uniref:glycine cleavage system aminomethyltransferase GcvT n=1 Tax=Candidatus Hadarchaeum sp. TaxID=2883567 RepID=UPI003D123CAE
MKQLHIANVHHALGAQMIEFAGWEMPLSYTSLAEEHMAVREAAGLFDVSHMGEFKVSGQKALEFLQSVTTNDVSKLEILGSQYSTVTNEKGGTRDDILVYRLAENDYLVVCNAANVDKIGNWFQENNKMGAEITDITMTTTLFALQGPKALPTLQKLTDFDLTKIKRFRAAWVNIAGIECLASRTGYTGEDGIEIFLLDEPQSNPERAEKLWKAILQAGGESGVKPCGLGARDTLRLEAGLCLYGNDLTEEISPLEARIEFAVKLDKGDFIGREALLEQKKSGLKKIRIGLRMLEPGIPRQGYSIFRDNERIGWVSSGTLSPLLKVGIAMGYVPPEVKARETLFVEIHGRKRKAEVVDWPFYNPEQYGFKRKHHG